MNGTYIITVDGPAASGKGTLAKRMADQLGYFYLDTGALYRLVGLAAHEKGIVPEDYEEDVASLASELSDTYEPMMMLNPRLKRDDIGQMASRCAALPKVRQALEELQRTLANTPPNDAVGSVLDGRDCGTVICPDADRKFFVTASTDIRAKRRHDELVKNGLNIDFDAVLQDMEIRDKRDTERAFRPLKPADDAIIIDTSDMTADQALDVVLGYVT